jgi:beta-N-acetylhexosaminidase
VTLFRHLNVTDASRMRALTDEIQATAPPGRPFLVGVDQEGGQLIGLGADATPFAGNMALGAAGDPALARRVASAIGRELRAVGVNVNYAPVCDLATNAANPGLGIRCFGDDPARAAALVEATVLGLADAGVAATAKHFPGGGEATSDPHVGLPVIDAPRDRFDRVELVPFRAALSAGAALVMTGHPAVPGLTGDALPATLSRAVLRDLLRGELGFQGVTISDALDMGAILAGGGHVDAAAILAAGQDLLLLPADPETRSSIEAGVAGLDTDPEPLGRVDRLRSRLSLADGDPSVVGCEEHLALADELARRSVTLLRDAGGLLPLRPGPDASIGVVMPGPIDRTPADTSSTVAPRLAEAVRRRHPRVHSLVVEPAPDAAEIAAARAWAADHDLLVIGTIDASFEPAQAELVRALLDTGRPAVTAALRTPWDLASYAQATTHAVTYSILPPSLDALAAALWGETPFTGALPVSMPEAVPS